MKIEDLSIRARIGFAGYILDSFFMKIENHFEAKNIIINKIWEIPEGNDIESWLEEFVELLPDVIFEEAYNHEDPYVFLTNNQFNCIKFLYEDCEEHILQIIKLIFEIVNIHVYGKIVDNGKESLEELKKIFDFAKKASINLKIEENNLFSIKNENGWGKTFSKNILVP
ncbi:MAG: hypothetical protein HC854_06325 [Flavobacterium sp.]|nr:hypothetical protein [Flavobacterium sp.]